MLLLQLGLHPSDKGLIDAFALRGIQRTLLAETTDIRVFLDATPYDFVFIDLDMPGQRGEALVQEIRKLNSQIPIFAFAVRADLALRVRVLDLGADDVLPANCVADEVLARARSLLRRTEQRMAPVLTCGPLAVDLDRRAVTVDGKPIRLSPTEYQLLEFLVRRQGKPVPRESCLAYIYAVRSEPDMKAIDVLVWRLRKKLAAFGHEGLIKNVWGHGFKLEAEAALPPAPEVAVPALAASPA